MIQYKSNYIINTMPSNTKHKIDELLKPLTPTEKIALLESLSKKYRRENSVNINHGQYNRRVEERPDELNLKAK